MSSLQPPKKKRWPYILGGVVLLLVVAGAIALWRLDAFLLERARTEAATYAKQLGRPIEIGDVSTRLLPSVGAEVENVVVGAAEGEPVPLLEMKRLEVAVALWPAITSGGKDLQVKNAEVSGLTLNYVQLPDGTTNVSRVQDKLAEQPPAEEQPADDTPTDLSAVRVDRAAITDATLRLVDRTGAQPRELAINDLDVEVKDLRAGKPLEVVLHAAVLADKQNFHVTLNAAPLPPRSSPCPSGWSSSPSPSISRRWDPSSAPRWGSRRARCARTGRRSWARRCPEATAPRRSRAGSRPGACASRAPRAARRSTWWWTPTCRAT
ncbi:AsmA family protein [Cystobacter fuscus]